MITSVGTRRYFNILDGEGAGRDFLADATSFDVFRRFSKIGLQVYPAWISACNRHGLAWGDGADETSFAFILCEAQKLLTFVVTNNPIYRR